MRSKLVRIAAICGLVGSMTFMGGWTPVDTDYGRYTPKDEVALDVAAYRVIAPEVVEEEVETPVDVVEEEVAPHPTFENEWDEQLYWAKQDNSYPWVVPYDMTEAEFMASFDETLAVLVDEGGYDGLTFVGPYGVFPDDQTPPADNE